MATIVNNPGSERVLEVDRTGDATAGWAVAIIILVAVIGGLFVWVYYHRPAIAPSAPANSTGGSINVTLPSNGNSGGQTGGGTSGTGGGGTNTGY